ncbi:MAG: alkaline phosphatase family protein [bacterium]|nr:alkaline phosphatase family protein [bacterium]
MKSDKRVFLVGIDGGTFNVIKNAGVLGRLPNFKKLLETGSHGILNSTLPPVTAPAWTSSITGVNPGKHGVFQFTEFFKDTYNPHLISSTGIKSKTIFEILSEQGVESIAFNVPLTFPPFKIKGNLISGMNATNTTKGFTYPPELEDELNTISEPYYPDIDMAYYLHRKKGSDFTEALLDVFERRKKALFHLIQNKPWQFFMAVFTETDRASHFFWDKQGKENDLLFQVYSRIDKMIGEILNILNENDIFMIISDHGFERYEYKFNLHRWLEKEGLLKFEKIKKNRIKFDFIKEFSSAEILEDFTKTVRVDELIIDYDKRKVIFAHPNSVVRYKFKVPFRSSLIFSIATDPQYWFINQGKGVIFKIKLTIGSEERYLYTKMINPKKNSGERKWIDEKIDLFEFSGKEVCLDFITNPDEVNLYNNAYWGEPYIRGFIGGEKDCRERIDWTKTKAYQMDQGGLFINLQGREAGGSVTITEYEGIVNKIFNAMIELKHKGKPIFSRVLKREDIYSGKYLYNAPDIIYDFEPGFWQVFWQDFPELFIENIDDSESYTGKHHPEGIFFARGVKLKQGVEIRPRNIIDITPTVLYLLGLEVPEYMDGLVITEILTNEYIQKNPVRTSKGISADRHIEESETDYDEKKSMEQLKGLGYI